MATDSPVTTTTMGADATTTDVTGNLGGTLQRPAPNTYSANSTSRSMGDTLRTELRNLKSDLDTLLSRATNMTEADLKQEYARLTAKFGTLKSAAMDAADQANRQLSHGMEVTSDYVREKPLQSVAIAAGVGMVIGMLLAPRH